MPFENKGTSTSTLALAAIVLIIVIGTSAALILETNGDAEEDKVKISNMNLIPSRTNPGQSVEVEVEVKNTTESKIEHDLKLKIDGNIEEKRNISLKGDQSKKVSFVIQKDEAKSYQLSVDGSSETLIVRENNKIEEYMDATAKIRKLDFKENVPIKFMTTKEFRNYIENELKNEYPNGFKEYELTLEAFGLFPEERDLEKTLLNLYTSQVSGFYDTEEEKFYIIEGKSYGAEGFVAVHELTHALQDQHFNLDTLPTEEKNNDDLSLASSALIEGGATYVGLRYQYKSENMIQYSSRIFKQSLNSPESTASLGENIPIFLIKTVNFPYYGGLPFVLEGLNEGWEGINKIYSDPPNSTEQIMHPEKYFEERDYPTMLEIPDLTPPLTSGWKMIEKNKFGEFGIGTLLLKHLPEAKNKDIEARNGWDGDSYHCYYNKSENKVAIAWISTWDTDKDAEEFMKRYKEVLEEKYSNINIITETKNSITLRTEKNIVYMEKRDKDIILLEGFPEIKIQEIRTKILTQTDREVKR